MSEVRQLKRYPMKGVEVWRNSKNRFVVFQLHYSANPAKDNDEFRESQKSGLTRAKFEQEYEIAWDAYEGKPVYSDWIKKIHASQERLAPEFGLPLLRGWDFGLTPACIIAQLQGEQLVVLRELVAINMGIKRFCETVVIPECNIHYAGYEFLDFIDPAGFAKAQTDETTCAQHMMACGIKKVQPGALTWEERRSSVEGFLTKHHRVGKEIHPNLLVDAAMCPTLVRGFDGGYRYPDKYAEIEPGDPRPIKDEHSHPHDAFQYLCSRVKKLTERKTPAIPSPGYGWAKRGA